MPLSRRKAVDANPATAKLAHPVAEWLLSDWNDNTWRLTATGDTPRFIGGALRGVVSLSFDHRMANGISLIDARYANLLEDTKRLIFYARAGAYAAGLQRAELQDQLLRDTYVLLDFMIARGLDEPVTLFGFDSLTPKLFEEYCEIAVTRGKAGLSNRDNALANFLSSIPEGETAPLREAAASIGMPAGALLRHRRLRQMLEQSNRVTGLSQKAGTTEYEPVRVRQPDNEVEGITRAAALINVWKHINDCGPYLLRPLRFDPFHYSGRLSAYKIAESYGATAKQKTPTIPPHIGLYYLNKAIEWVTCYGDALVNYHNDLLDELADIQTSRTSRSDYYAPQVFSRNPPPPALKKLQISRFHAHPTGTPITIRREELSVVDAIRCLTTATFVLFATFTARRRSEILHSTVDSVIENWDGFDFVFGIRKVSSTEKLERLSRPIPDLLNAGATQLASMHKLARENTDDTIHAQQLFMSSVGHFRMVRPLHANITSMLDEFADFIEVPLDADKRRWYLRPHECRRLFATAYFWHKEFHDLDALSWFLGHLTPEETRHYILDSVGQLPLDEATAQRTVQAIRQGSGAIGFDSLRAALKSQFGIDDIDAVHDVDLETYVLRLLEDDNLDVRVVISPEDGSSEKLLVVTSFDDGGKIGA